MYIHTIYTKKQKERQVSLLVHNISRDRFGSISVCWYCGVRRSQYRLMYLTYTHSMCQIKKKIQKVKVKYGDGIFNKKWKIRRSIVGQFDSGRFTVLYWCVCTGRRTGAKYIRSNLIHRIQFVFVGKFCTETRYYSNIFRLYWFGWRCKVFMLFACDSFSTFFFSYWTLVQSIYFFFFRSSKITIRTFSAKLKKRKGKKRKENLRLRILQH